MKKTTFRAIAFTLALMSVSAAQATLSNHPFNSGFANNGNVPDGNVTGWSDTRTLSGLPDTIQDINLRINLVGGFNGDLFAYLSHSGGTAYLLNRVGKDSGNSFGYSNSGMSIWLDDTAANDIHQYQTVSGYSIVNESYWQPDGRATDPATVTTSSPRTSMLSTFNGMNPNGSWTLFLADMSRGEQTQVGSWEMEIQAVPEPVNVALGIFGGTFGALAAWRMWRAKRAERGVVKP